MNLINRKKTQLHFDSIKSVSLVQTEKKRDKNVFLVVYSYTFIWLLFTLDQPSEKKDYGLLYGKKNFFFSLTSLFIYTHFCV
jgi:hypothetical protein